MDSITAIFNIYFCNNGTVLVDSAQKQIVTMCRLAGGQIKPFAGPTILMRLLRIFAVKPSTLPVSNTVLCSAFCVYW